MLMQNSTEEACYQYLSSISHNWGCKSMQIVMWIPVHSRVCLSFLVLQTTTSCGGGGWGWWRESGYTMIVNYSTSWQKSLLNTANATNRFYLTAWAWDCSSSSSGGKRAAFMHFNVQSGHNFTVRHLDGGHGFIEPLKALKDPARPPSRANRPHLHLLIRWDWM